MTIEFYAVLHRPAKVPAGETWNFLRLPQQASDQLPSRSMVSVEGSLQGAHFVATLEPDGEGGHWLKVEPELSQEAKVKPGDTIVLSIRPTTEEPEPKVPNDIADALRSHPNALDVWGDITAKARRDWIYWIVSGKKAETRMKRLEVAISKLSSGDRRPCCFDRSGLYSKSLCAPKPADD
jgi:hypothetical protein